MLQQIKRQDNGALIYECEADSRKDAVAAAVRAGVSLSGANLSDSDLRWANLSGVNLSGVNLSGANLSGANLRVANLSGANLSGANLSGANLSVANLSDSDLSGANLSWANLDISVCRMDFGGWSICVREDATSIGCKDRSNADWLWVDHRTDPTGRSGSERRWPIRTSGEVTN